MGISPYCVKCSIVLDNNSLYCFIKSFLYRKNCINQTLSKVSKLDEWLTFYWPITIALGVKIFRP